MGSLNLSQVNGGLAVEHLAAPARSLADAVWTASAKAYLIEGGASPGARSGHGKRGCGCGETVSCACPARKLVRHAALDQAAPPSDAATCTGPHGENYTPERLMVQSAICYREAGQPERAVTLFQQHLKPQFAPRDRAFFTAHLSGALVAAGDPDEAAATALLSLALAADARFGQALAELHRTDAALSPHRRRPIVKELHDRLTALTAV